MRGAPAIAIVGCLSLAVELHSKENAESSVSKLETFVLESLDYLVSARPTAVNMARAAQELGCFVRQEARREGVTTESLQKRCGSSLPLSLLSLVLLTRIRGDL